MPPDGHAAFELIVGAFIILALGRAMTSRARIARPETTRDERDRFFFVNSVALTLSALPCIFSARRLPP